MSQQDIKYDPLGNVKVAIQGTPAFTVSGTPSVQGDVAHNSADSGNPNKIGAKAYEHDGTEPGTPVAEASRANAVCDRYGRIYVCDFHPNHWSTNENNSTAQTNNQLKAAPGAGYSLYITDIVLSVGATAGTVKIVEDTAGTPVDKAGPYYFAINGGLAWPMKTPIRCTANKDVGYTSVTVTTHTVTVNGFTAP